MRRERYRLLDRGTKFIDCLLDYQSSLHWISSLMFVINCWLLVRVIAMSRISKYIFPKLARQLEIALVLGKPCSAISRLPDLFRWAESTRSTPLTA